MVAFAAKRQRKTNTSSLRVEPEVAARQAGLTYVDDAQPGISRQKHGNSLRFVGPRGYAIKDRRTLIRIRSLVTPPAWTVVWICTLEDGHLQATGRDAR